MSPPLWQVKGLHPDVRKVAREAARRSGVSVTAWLNSLIIEGGSKPPDGPLAPAVNGMSRAPRGAYLKKRPGNQDLVSIVHQIEELKRRVDTLSNGESSRQAAGSASAEELGNAYLAEIIARIERQLDRLNVKLMVVTERPDEDSPKVQHPRVSGAQKALRETRRSDGPAFEKLETSEALLSRLCKIKRGVDDVLEQVNELRARNEKKSQSIQHEFVESSTHAASAPAEAVRHDVAASKDPQSATDHCTRDTFAALHVTIEQMVDRLAYLRENLPKGEGHQALGASVKPLPLLSADAPVPSPRHSPFGDLNCYASQSDGRSREIHEPAASLAKRELSESTTQTAVSLREKLTENADTLDGTRALSAAIPSNFQEIIKKLADRLESVELQCADHVSLRRIVGLPSSAAPPTPPHGPITSDLPPDGPLVTGSGARQIRAIRVAKEGEYPDPAAAQSLSLMLGGKLAPRTKSVIICIGLIALLLGALHLTIGFRIGSHSPSTRPSVSQIEGTQSEAIQTEALASGEGMPSKIKSVASTAGAPGMDAPGPDKALPSGSTPGSATPLPRSRIESVASGRRMPLTAAPRAEAAAPTKRFLDRSRVGRRFGWLSGPTRSQSTRTVPAATISGSRFGPPSPQASGMIPRLLLD